MRVSGPNWKNLERLCTAPKKVLSKMYWDKDMSLQAIADHYGVSFTSVRLHFKELGIKRRARSEAMRNGWRNMPDESRAKIIKQSRKNMEGFNRNPENRQDASERMKAMNKEEWHKDFSRKNMAKCRKTQKLRLRNTDDKLQVLLYRTLKKVLPGKKVVFDKPVCDFHYFLDIAFSKSKVAFEIDSDRVHNEDTQEADAARQKRIEGKGWKVYRITHEELVMNFLGVLGRIVSLVYASSPTSAQKSKRPKLRLVI